MQHSYTIQTHHRGISDWILRLWVSKDDKDYTALKRAVTFYFEMREAHPKAFSEGPDCLEVAETLRSIDADQTTLLAAILSSHHLVPYIELADIARDYGEPVALLCENMRTLHYFRVNTKNNPDLNQKDQAEQVRRMLLAMLKDIRAVLVKLAWHLHYLRFLSRQETTPDHLIVGRQTLELFAPLANRLGISQFKWEMEDLAFRFIEPEQYKFIAKALADTRIAREKYIENFIELIQNFLKEINVPAKVYGRPKHIYSIWKKMQRKRVGIDGLFDLRAIRIIVNDRDTCFEVISLIHNKWEFVPEEYDNYIDNVKPNGYQSIHTVVIGPENQHVEIQIRTQSMHEQAELGVAAHWRYKEGGKHDIALERVISSLRKLLDNDVEDGDFLENFKTELFSDRVFVFTPKGRVIDLIKGATPLDFAYAIHTDIGHRCQGAKVNGGIVPLNYELHNGEQVEVLTGKEAKPKMNWLNESLGYAKSPRTKQKINHWFRQQNHEKNYQDGQTIFERKRHLLNLKQTDIEAIAKSFGRPNERDFFIALGRGDVSPQQLTTALLKDRNNNIQLKIVKKPVSTKADDIIVGGVENIVTQIASCCQPIYGDKIIGYITSQGRGIAVHRSDCVNMIHLPPEQQNRLIEVTWANNNVSYAVDILIKGYNQPGFLRDITDLLAREQINILSINTHSSPHDDLALIEVSIHIKNSEQLSEALERLTQLSFVTDVQRKA